MSDVTDLNEYRDAMLYTDYQAAYERGECFGIRVTTAEDLMVGIALECRPDEALVVIMPDGEDAPNDLLGLTPEEARKLGAELIAAANDIESGEVEGVVGE